MKDGSTHLAHKAEHAVDLSSGVLLAVTLQGADQGDSATIHQTLAEAGEAVAELMEPEAVMAPAEEPQVHSGGIEEVVADKGYHSGAVLQALQERAHVAATFPSRTEGRGSGKGKRRSSSR
jgi:transposase